MANQQQRIWRNKKCGGLCKAQQRCYVSVLPVIGQHTHKSSAELGENPVTTTWVESAPGLFSLWHACRSSWSAVEQWKRWYYKQLQWLRGVQGAVRCGIAITWITNAARLLMTCTYQGFVRFRNIASLKFVNPQHQFAVFFKFWLNILSLFKADLILFNEEICVDEIRLWKRCRDCNVLLLLLYCWQFRPKINNYYVFTRSQMIASFVGTLYVNIPPFIFFCSFNLIFESKAMRPCLSWSPSSNQVTKFWAYK